MTEQEQTVPDGWVREERLAGMDTIGRDGYDDIGGGFKCDNCAHYVPLESIEGDTCPQCGRGGMIGTVVMGIQEVTILSPEGWFSDE